MSESVFRSLRGCSMVLALGFSAVSMGAPPKAQPDPPCLQFSRANCQAAASGIYTKFQADADFRLGRAGARSQGSSEPEIANLRTALSVGKSCLAAAEAHDAKMKKSHDIGVPAAGQLVPNIEASTQQLSKNDLAGAKSTGQACSSSAHTAIQHTTTCSAEFGIAKADQDAAQRVAEVCQSTVQGLRQKLKAYAAQQRMNPQLRATKTQVLNQIDANVKQLTAILEPMAPDPEVGVRVGASSFADISAGLQITSAQNEMAVACDTNRDIAVKVSPACTGTTGFGDSMAKKQGNESAPESPEETASSEPREVAPMPASPYPYGYPMGPDPRLEAQRQMQAELDERERRLAEAENDYGRRAANPQSGGGAPSSPEQASPSGQGEDPSPQQGAKQASSPQPITPHASKSTAKTTENTDAEKEAEKKAKEIAETAKPFKQTPEPQQKVAISSKAKDEKSADGDKSDSERNVTQSSSKTIEEQKKLQSEEGIVTANGRHLADGGAAVFTAFKIDCNTGLGKCSKVPIACGSKGISGEDQKTCDAEAAKRASKRQRALSSEYLK